MAVERDELGRIKKGSSGNPTGRPKSANIPKEILAEVRKLKTNREKIEYWDKYLLENPQTTQDVKGYIALMRDSYTPKLKTIESNTKVDTKIEISWVIDNKAIASDDKELIDVSNNIGDTAIDITLDENESQLDNDINDIDEDDGSRDSWVD